jgi:leucyl aminopeptidase
VKAYLTFAALLQIAGIAACSADKPKAFVRKDFKSLLTIADRIESSLPVLGGSESDGPGERSVIWRGANQEVISHLRVNDELSRRTQGSPMVMVSFAHSSPLAEQLRTAQETILWSPGTDDADGFGLIEVKSIEKLTRIAKLAHARTGLACGLVQLVSGESLLVADSYVAPEYIESVKLSDVESLLALPSEDEIKKLVQTLEAMGSRFHNLPSGLLTSDVVKDMMTTAGSKIPGFTVTQFDHSSTHLTTQKSVIATIPGEQPDLPMIIIGAHLDSINQSDENIAPGADDDATGIATLVESIRTIAAMGAKFERTIEFHGYAAEEIGLIGSANIAQQYRATGKKVAAMFQLDMVSWSSDPTDITIYLVTNDTNPILRRSLKELMKTYLDGKYAEGTLRAGTSDHKSWTNNGFNAVFPFENPIDYNEALHTPKDTLETINNFPLAKQFTKLTLAFLSHHAGLIAAKSEYEAKVNAAENSLTDDIKIAVTTRNSGVWDLAAATVNDAEKIESCVVSEIKSATCIGSLVQLIKVGDANNRRFFLNSASQPVFFNDGEVRMFIAYDSKDSAIQQRTVIFRKK